MKTKLITTLTAIIAVAMFGITGCEREEETDQLTGTGIGRVGGGTRLQVRLMDAPSPYNFEAVYLQITGLSVYVEPTATGQVPRWVSLPVAAGTYNMLSLVNGEDVLLADELVPQGRITRTILKLGEGNTVVVDGRTHHLVMATNGDAGLSMKTEVETSVDALTTLMLDFDVARSIKLMPDGYKLRPALRAVTLERTGSIHGKVQAVRGSVAIFAYNGVQQYTTYADPTTGNFLLRGLPPGRYTVRIYYPFSDSPVTHDAIIVRENTVTELPEGV